MIQAQVFNGEKHERGPLWYSMFVGFFVLVIIASLWTKNWTGVIVLAFLIGGYLFFSLMHMQVVTMNADDNGIQIGEERTQWAELIGYMVEINQETQEVQNIVLVSGQGGDVYTLNDTNENIEELLFFVDTKIELLGGYKQSFIEKIIRRCKI